MCSRFHAVAAGLAVLAFSGIACASSGSDPVKVSFQTQNYASWADYFAHRPSGEATIDGMLALPPGQGRFPAVVIMHGGTGITAAESSAAKHLVQAGFASFLVDRGSGRGLHLGPHRMLRITLASQLADAMNALAALAKQPRIDPSRVGIIGYSQGGAIVVALEGKTLLGPYASGPHYAAYVGVYPVCVITSHGPDASTGAPTLLLVGDKDEVAPASGCHAIATLREQTKTKSNITLVDYAYAEHGWEDSDIPDNAYNPSMPTLKGCPIVTVAAPDRFFTFDGKNLTPIASTDYYPVFRNCMTRGAGMAYSADASAKSRARWIEFFKKNLAAH